MSAVPAPDPGPDAGAVWHHGDPFGEQRAAADGAVVIDRSHRTVLSLTGPERQSWLHNISSQHVSALPEGAVTQNLSLDGQGRVEDHWWQTELAERTVLDTEGWRGEALLGFLRKMIFWADVTVEPADLAVLTLLGPGVADPAVLAALGVTTLPAESTAVALPGGEAPAAGAGARCAGLEPRHFESDDVVRAECSDELLVEPRARLWRGRKERVVRV